MRGARQLSTVSPDIRPDIRSAAIVRINGGRLATRNGADFQATGLELISPWDL